MNKRPWCSRLDRKSSWHRRGWWWPTEDGHSWCGLMCVLLLWSPSSGLLLRGEMALDSKSSLAKVGDPTPPTVFTFPMWNSPALRASLKIQACPTEWQSVGGEREISFLQLPLLSPYRTLSRQNIGPKGQIILFGDLTISFSSQALSPSCNFPVVIWGILLITLTPGGHFENCTLGGLPVLWSLLSFFFPSSNFNVNKIYFIH